MNSHDTTVHDRTTSTLDVERTITIESDNSTTVVQNVRKKFQPPRLPHLSRKRANGVYEQLFDFTNTVDEGEINLSSETPVLLHHLDDNISKLKTFASGGQGILFQGEDQPLNRQIAIKSLRPELCDDEAQRKTFITEARVTAQLEHPAILPIHSLLEEKGNGLAVTMKLIHGKSLKSYLSQVRNIYGRHGFQSAVEEKALHFRLEIFLKICDALDYAHSRNIMHCDLKPENIMLGEYHEAYLMDWGIARPILSPEYDPLTWTVKKKVSGTPAFISPEALRGEYYDQRADIYSMGLILFEVVSLTKAFSGKEMPEIFRKVRQHELNPLKHHFGAAIPADLKAIVGKATAFEPEDRYQNIRDLAQDLRKFMQHDEVSANPDNFFRKMYRCFIIKHGRFTLIAALIILLAAVGHSALTLWHILTEERTSFQEERVTTRRNKLIAMNFINGLDVANAFDRELTEIEHNLYDRTKLMCYFLNGMIGTNNHGTEKRVLPVSAYSDPSRMPESYQKYPQYAVKIDFEHISYISRPDSDPDLLKKRLNAAENMFNPIRELMMESPFGTRLTLSNRQALMENMLKNRVPVSLVSFSFTDGLYLVYPGEFLPPEFDPRKREWYQTRISPDAQYAGWSVPYLGFVTRVLGITYSIRMETEDRKICGVAALILDLSNVLDIMLKQNAGQAGLLEQTFLDNSGSIIVTTDQKLNGQVIKHYSGLDKSGGGASGYQYPNPELIREILMKRDGFMEQTENGHRIVYIFASCRKLDWFYLEKFDLDKVVE